MGTEKRKENNSMKIRNRIAFLICLFEISSISIEIPLCPAQNSLPVYYTDMGGGPILMCSEDPDATETKASQPRAGRGPSYCAQQ